MKRFIAVFLAIILVLTLAGCQKDTISNESENLDKKLTCSMCGHMNSIDNNFCSACGCELKASIEIPEDYCNENSNSFEDVSTNYCLLDYFINTADEPLIIYKCSEIAKDSTIDTAYVIKNGKCRKYYCPTTTLGELTKMTDEQILERLEDYYQNGLSEALSIWENEFNTSNAIQSGKVKLYDPRSYDIKGCLFTDSTGNSVVGELLFFPQVGVSDNPYIIEYPQYTDYEHQFMNYYGTSEDSSSHRDIKFKVESFNTGYGVVDDINQINDMYFITSNSMTTGIVYNTNYYGLKAKNNEWVQNGGTLCFRVDNPANFSLSLDTLSSSNVSHVDPTENNILQISHSYYNAYYSSFKPLKPRLIRIPSE